MTTLDITAETLTDLTAQLLDALVPDLSALEPCADVPRLLAEAGALGASVEIGSAPPIEVALSCSPRLGALLAAAMLGAAPEALVEEELLDAVGELANILGGNVKALGEDGLPLSLPKARRAAPGTIPLNVPDGAAGFLFGGEPLALSVVTTAPSPTLTTDGARVST